MKFDDIYVIIISDQETLGEWRMDDIGVQRLFSNQFLLDLAGEEMVFIADDPLGFAYEGVGHIDETSQRLSKRRRFRKKKARPQREVAEVVDADREEAARVKERRRYSFEAAPMPAVEAEPATPAFEPAAAASLPPAVEQPVEAGPEDHEEAGAGAAPIYEQMFEEPAAEVDEVAPETTVPPPPTPLEEPATRPEPEIEGALEIEEVVPLTTAAFLEPSTSPNGQPTASPHVASEPEPVPVVAERVSDVFEDDLVIEEVDGVSMSATFESAVTPRPVLPVIEPTEPSPDSIEDEAETPVGEDGEAELEELFPAPPRAEEPFAPAAIEPEPEPPVELVPMEPVDVDAEHRSRREGRLRRRRREEEPVHEHHYQEKAAVGGIIRRVCSECGHVSFGSRDIYEPW